MVYTNAYYFKYDYMSQWLRKKCFLQPRIPKIKKHYECPRTALRTCLDNFTSNYIDFHDLTLTGSTELNETEFIIARGDYVKNKLSKNINLKYCHTSLWLYMYTL